jgi:hypothetical protein
MASGPTVIQQGSPVVGFTLNYTSSGRAGPAIASITVPRTPEPVVAVAVMNQQALFNAVSPAMVIDPFAVIQASNMIVPQVTEARHFVQARSRIERINWYHD